MAIGEKQVARTNFKPEDPDGLTVVHDVGVAVRHGGRAGKHGKLHASDGGDIALISKPDAELLDGVGNVACVELPDSFQDLRWQRAVVVPSQVAPQQPA